MFNKIILRLSIFIIFFITGLFSFCQNQTKCIDGRKIANYCSGCQAIFNKMPKEVLFGVQINDNGEVYFSMSDKNWFNKIFKSNSFGVTIDIISKERYDCTKNISKESGIPGGIILPGVYKNELVKQASELVQGGIFTKMAGYLLPC